MIKSDAFKRNDLPYLDGLRGLAALFVVFSHFSIQGWANFGELSFEGAGKSGVYLFFLLSAYLLTRIMLSQGEASWQIPSLFTFFARRFLRIYPLFFVFLLVCLGTSLLNEHFAGRAQGIPYTMDFNKLADHLLLQQGQGVLWSIPVEFKFYLILPLVALALFLGMRWSPLMVLVSALAFCACVEIWLMLRESRAGGIYLRTYIQIFIIGSTFAALDLRFENSERGQSPVTRFWASAIFMLSTIGLTILIPPVFAKLSGLENPKKLIHGMYLVHALLWLGVLFGLKYGNSILRVPFQLTATRSVGMISFSLYLWHELVISALKSLDFSGPSTVAWIVPLSLSLLVSWLSFTYIEKPFLLIKLPRPSRARVKP